MFTSGYLAFLLGAFSSSLDVKFPISGSLCPYCKITLEEYFEVPFVSFEMVEMPRRGLNWLVKNLGYL